MGAVTHVNALHIITFLSDFGTGGGYVAACEATMVRLCPETRVFHISHDVPVGEMLYVDTKGHIFCEAHAKP